MTIATLTLCRFDRLPGRAWAFAQMGLSRRPLRRMPGLTFFKLLGSGGGAGFLPRPNPAVWAILCAWSSRAAAEAGLAGRPFARWRARAGETAQLLLAPQAARGAWSGRTPFAVADGDGGCESHGPIAALTRASIRPRALPAFWRHVPTLDRLIGANRDVLLKVGVGEVPWLHQVTFTVWPDAASMARYARAPGPHADAIRAVREEGLFREDLYARFRVAGASGTWEGRPVADTLARVAA